MVDELTLYVWDESGTAIHDPLFLRMTGFKKASQYPAGLYGVAAFMLPRNILANPSRLRAGYQVEVWDGGSSIYHGYVESVEEVNRRGTQGAQVNCLGAWGWIMEKRGLERYWADDRIDTGAWVLDTAGDPDYSTIRRDNGAVRILPKAESWVTNDLTRVLYTAPTGEKIGRTSISYDMQEGGQAWALTLAEMPSTNIINITTSGTGTDASNTTTSPTQIGFQLEADANQTPTSNGTYYAEMSNVVMFATRDHASATLGNMNAYEVGLDMVDLLGVDETAISATGDLDTSLTESIIPFVSNGYEPYGSQLARIAGYGDTSQNPIGFGLRPPFLSPDGRPQLFLEKYPVLTDYEFEISVEEAGVAVRLNVDDVWNYIILEYTDAEGEKQTVTPADDATLEDTDSQALYGIREKTLTIPAASYNVAYGQRFLARHKDPTYAVTRPIVVSRLRAKGGGNVPASQIDAGRRLRLVDLPNHSDQDGIGGVTLIITETKYDHSKRLVALSVGGRPDSLALWLSRQVE